jgi:hypothetical protein
MNHKGTEILLLGSLWQAYILNKFYMEFLNSKWMSIFSFLVNIYSGLVDREEVEKINLWVCLIPL